MNRRITVDRQLYTEKTLDQEYRGDEKLRDNEKPIDNGLSRKLKLGASSCSKRKAFNFVSTHVFPVLDWLPRYKVKEYLLHDLISGFTVGTFNIPQGMSYALLASMPPVVGLYLSFFAPLIYAITGTSRHIAHGTFAVVSLMSGAAIERVVPMTDPGLTQSDDEAVTALWDNITDTSSSSPAASYDRDHEKILAATALAFLTGLIQFTMGLCQLGFVSIYLSHPLVRGFTTGAACHVVVSQLKYLFGLSEWAGNHSGILAIIYSLVDIFEDLGRTNYVEVLISLACIVILAIFKVINKKYKKKIKFPLPIELILIILFTAISSPLKLSTGHAVDIIGPIPTGLPAPNIPGFKYAGALIGDAFSIAIVLFSINISLARLFAKTHNYAIRPNVEMRAYGVGNLFVSFFSCFPTGSSLSRSLVQEQTGCKTQVTGVVNSIFLLVVLLAIGPLFQPLPKAVLASIIIVNLKGMFLQFEDLPTLWRTDKIDLSVWLVTFVATIFLNLDLGLMVGFLYGLLSIVIRIQLPRSYPLGNVPNTEIYKDVHKIQQAVEIPGVKIFCYEAPICYANTQNFANKLARATGINPLMKKQAKMDKSEVEMDAMGEGDDSEIPVSMCVIGSIDSINIVANGDPESARNAADGNPESATVTANRPEVHTVVLDMSACSFIDTVGTQALRELASNYRHNWDVQLALASCSDQVLATLDLGVRGQEGEPIPAYVSVHDAVTAAVAGHALSSSASDSSDSGVANNSGDGDGATNQAHDNEGANYDDQGTMYSSMGTSYDEIPTSDVTM